ncbi:hypothetical protein CAPTEDRAFT_122327 [Capitella teleta]|uniref:TM2 domain-containing protein n=1 Tax=Capitella teleta TaxID=283909 RepID=R7ULT7_CAPTE|nr:hypothetical protein CAPTEDRAFT_122327 [Capitella teleta]|eukprot:ELU07494.1 hypothetical protein CAPTEDRAFT_122327 [Capitella teleta]
MAEHPEVLGGGTPIYKEVPVPPEPTPPVYIPIRNPLSLIPAYCFNIFLGVIGAHHAYLRRWAFSFFYVVTGGGFGVGWIVDLFRLNCLVDEANCKLLDPDYVTKKSCIDAYILWFPLGLFGQS